ncbi:MAG: exodeoxyribonuclease VII large subunit [Wolinella sp.]
MRVGGRMGALSVSELNEQIKSLLEATFCAICVHGEVSNLTYHTSGHVYLTLKDSASSIRAVIFKGNASRLRFRIEPGMDITIFGALSLYAPRGEYQILVQSAEPTGIGARTLAFNQLKEELRKLGYFEAKNKKPLPRFAQKIALITSVSGAALQDMLRVAQKRWALVEFFVINTLVQGEGAAEMIAKSIAYADSMGMDVIVVGRGGGSIEDLWAFNERVVAEAIYHAKTPIVSAVGHEIDTMISDFVADLRAPTPSAAMELILPDCNEWLIRLDGLCEEFERLLLRSFNAHAESVESLAVMMNRVMIPAKIKNALKELHTLEQAFSQAFVYQIASRKSELASLPERLESGFMMAWNLKVQLMESLLAHYRQSDPKHKAQGYVQLSRAGKVVRLGELRVADEVRLSDGSDYARVSVLEVGKIEETGKIKEVGEGG